MKRIIRIVPVIFLLIVLIQGCVLKVVKLNLQTDFLQIIVGESTIIDFTVDPADSKVSFLTNNDSIATVSSGGLVTAVGQGATSITVEATRDGFKKAQGTVNITVLPKPLYVITFNVYDIHGAVQGASIVFNSEAKITDVDGKAVFSDVSPGNMAYTVSKIGYHDITGDINVDGSKQVDIALSKKSYLLTTNTIGQGTIVKNPDKTTFLHGEAVQLAAVPDEGWSFAGWSGDYAGLENPLIITMDGTKTFTANFDINRYDIEVSADPQIGGSVFGAGTYNHGDQVNLTAVSNTAYEFVNWTEDHVEVSKNPNYSFTATRNRTLVANFVEKTYTLTIATSGSGSVDRNPDKELYTHGEIVNLTAIPSTGWNFVSWSGAIVGNANPVNITMNADRSVTASFSIKKLTVTASSNPAAGGSVIGAGVFDYGELVTLVATPNEGYEFVNWTENGSQVSPDPEYSFILTTDRSLVANFALKTYELRVNVLGNGSVQKSPDLDKYLHGEIVELTAEPAQGWSFDSWSGDLEGSQNPASITMNDNKEATATFRANQYTVSVISSPEEGGLVDGAGSFAFGEEIVVTAQANDCYMFIGWYEGGLLVSEEDDYYFIVDRDIELEARFVNAVESKEFRFILENLFLGRKYEVTMNLDLRITKVRFIYPDIDPNIQTPIPDEVLPDVNGDVYISSFWTNTEADSILILCYAGDKLVSQCVESLY